MKATTTVDIQAKLTGFAMLGATWVMWVLVGLSVGGLAVAIDRAVYLIRASDNVRRLKTEILAFLKRGQIDAARQRLAQSRSFEARIVANAAFIGLLGTVIGIIRAFAELNGAAGKVTSGLMTEVGEALVATAIGIMVALPAVASFNRFQRVTKTRLSRAEAFCTFEVLH